MRSRLATDATRALRPPLSPRGPCVGEQDNVYYGFANTSNPETGLVINYSVTSTAVITILEGRTPGLARTLFRGD
eukprot:2167658-Prymnesium_polylepis.1